MIGLSGKPVGVGLSPVWPGPGTNGDVLGTTAADEDAEELLSGADELLSGADELLSGADELLSGADELLSGPHGPWLRTNWPDHPL
jgi:X-X-X-Leu-X-X-Gly heptad repeat protein